jgi:hypothetical protein
LRYSDLASPIYKGERAYLRCKGHKSHILAIKKTTSLKDERVSHELTQIYRYLQSFTRCTPLPESFSTLLKQSSTGSLFARDD